MNTRKTRRNILSAFFIALIFLFTSSAFSADKWLQPPATSGMDTWFGTVYNLTAQHDARDRVGGWGDRYYSLLRFDLSGLPQTATQAIIWRYAIADGGTPTDIKWLRMDTQWQSNTATWSSISAQGAFALLGTTAGPTQPGYWYGTDITSLYNVWRLGLTPLNNVKNYGLLLAPVSNNNNYSSFASSHETAGHRPQLQVTYTPTTTDNVIKLRWPLATTKPTSPSSAFGSYWGTGVSNCVGQSMTHVGVDIPNAVGNPVYAAEDGVVKEVLYNGTTWMYAIVLEHNHPTNGGKFTTVYWHVNPYGTFPTSTPSTLVFVPKGMQIATIANISGGGSHLHLGVRLGAYNGITSDKGALPTNACTELPTYRENFLNAWNPAEVILQ